MSELYIQNKKDSRISLVCSVFSAFLMTLSYFNLVLSEWGLKLNGKAIFPDFLMFSLGVDLN